MKQDAVINNLEKALLDRAEKLAKEYLSRAERARLHVIEDAQERLHLREQREVLTAQADSERQYRRRIQANELQLQGKLDQIRWSLIQSIIQELPGELEKLAAETKNYHPLLQQLILKAADSIESDHLVAEFNQRDLDHLKDNWETFIKEMGHNKTIELSMTPHQCTGGVLVRSHDNRIRIDNTFEGRISRFSKSLQQVITEQLFARDVVQGGSIHG